MVVSLYLKDENLALIDVNYFRNCKNSLIYLKR